MKIYLANDTSKHHAGCMAVMRSLRCALSEHEIIATHAVGEESYDAAALNACDVLFVNGEGTIHHRGPRADFLMHLLALAQERGKKTFLVNALFQQEPPYFPEVLGALDYFSVREPRSAESARRCGGDPVMLLDSCADPQYLTGRPRKQLSAITMGKTHPESPVHGVLEALSFEQFRLNCKFEDVVATLKTCKLYITGQHHGVYAAGLAGIPFVPLPSNSHKIESLIEWSGLPIKVCTTAEEITAQIPVALANREVYTKFHNFLLSQRVFGRADLARALAGKHRPRCVVQCKPEAKSLAMKGNLERHQHAAFTRLRHIVEGRTIGVLLHGNSITELQNRITEFQDLDLCWCSLNLFRVMEQKILGQINQELSFVYCSSPEELPRRLEDLEGFLSRSEAKLLITTFKAMGGLGHFVGKFRNQILFIEEPDVPRKQLPNSLTLLLQALVRAEATSRIILFGADGLLDKRGPIADSYFGREILEKENRSWNLIKDTIQFNEQFAASLDEICAKYDITPIEIINCSPNSYLTPFPKISYDELREHARRRAPVQHSEPTLPPRQARDEDPVDRFLADPVSSSPRWLERDYHGYNVVLSKGRFYAFLKTLSEVDVTELDDAAMDEYRNEGKGFVAESYAEMTRLVDELGYSATPLPIQEGYKDYNILKYHRDFYGFAQSLGHMDISQVEPSTLDRLQEAGTCMLANSADEVRRMIDAVAPLLPPRLIEEGYKAFNLLQHNGRFYGVAQLLGPMELRELDDTTKAEYRRNGTLFIAESLEEVKRLVDEYGVEPPPKLVEEGYRGFNILLWHDKHHALAQSLGPLDLPELDEDALRLFQDIDKYVIADTIAEAKRLIDGLQDAAHVGVGRGGFSTW